MNKHFQNELVTAVQKYPNLVIKHDNQEVYLKGILDIPNGSGNIEGSFLIEIRSVEKFPYRFPKVYEVGGDIPNHIDWHKYSNNLCCLTVEPDEIVMCNKGITLVNFIENIVIPYFANQLYRKIEGRYLNEYSHGFLGIYEYYADLFKENRVTVWLGYLDKTFSAQKKMRNEKCYCGSGQKFKICHLQVEQKLKILGKEKILIDIKNIIK